MLQDCSTEPATIKRSGNREGNDRGDRNSSWGEREKPVCPHPTPGNTKFSVVLKASDKERQTISRDRLRTENRMQCCEVISDLYINNFQRMDAAKSCLEYL